jgi:hypothetical protein
LRPNIYTLLVVTTIALHFASIVQAQVNNEQHLVQSNTITANNNKQLPDNVTAEWYDQALTSIQQLEEQIKPVQPVGSYTATNMRSRTGFQITPAGYIATSLEGNNWEVAFQLKGIGRSKMQWKPSSAYSTTNTANELRYNFDNVQIEYLNNTNGLRQNFLINRKMPGGGALKVTIEPITDLQPRLLNSNSLAFSNADNNMMLAYEDLHVWDANHKALPAAMHFNNGLLTIEVDDSKATYPVTIDPLNKTPEWSSTANGLLSNLTSLQINASLYGYTVTGLGDVNGDGYGDAAISAPALIDIFSGTGSLASVGAVFVFYGSPAGLSSTPAKTLQPNTAVAGALFGLSVDAGDVTGDGINDIIVGAPLDSYTTTASGVLPLNVNVKAGKVYVFPGGNSAAANPTNFIEIKLQGTGFFSTGVAGLLLSNVSVNALFGFSVAATGDLNGDGKSDIVVGAPAYLGVGLSAIQNGAAFVYYSSNLATTTPVQLETPTLNMLGLLSLPILHNGLLFGFSVDGAGDYNNDGHPDVVASSPAGVDISALTGILTGQVLSGTANVYYGTASGINSNVGTVLKPATGGLLGNAANLFGYKVKGLKNANGQRNGNIAIGAPTGGLVPNALSLTIQTGNVHVFNKKSNPGSSVTSNQVLESPRSSSLLSVLNTLRLNALFGAAIDNAYDINCDGYSDIVVGEPLSSGATLSQLQANAVGGNAYVYLGSSSGIFDPVPQFTAGASHGNEFLSVNAVSLYGYSVAGVPDSRGAGTTPRILAGAPAAALDFDNSLLNLGSTLGLLFDFLAVDNGPGKSFLFNTGLCVSTPLPVTLIEFKGQEKETNINLTWKVADEKNLNRYEVQRSRDGVTFETIGVVFPLEDGVHPNYAFNDKNATTGINYYRLKMIDNDGAFKYSNLLMFTLGAPAGIQIVVAPNPTVDMINVQLTGLNETSYRLELHSLTGQKFMERAFNVTGYRHNEKLMRTASMTPGVYFLTVFGKNNKKITSNRVIVL